MRERRTFWSWAKVDPKSGCWLWTGHCATGGYGGYNYQGARHNAHRVAWALANNNGRLPPTRLHVCHKCDVRKCVRPDHLFLGTAADNLADMRHKGRGNLRNRNGPAKLSLSDVRRIRNTYNRGPRKRDPNTGRYVNKAGWTQRALASELGVTREAVSRIICNRNWRVPKS